MALVKLEPSQPVSADNDYYFDCVAGRLYYFNLGYLAGTGTVTVKKRIGYSGTSYSNYKLPSDPTANMALAATGTETGYDIRATSNRVIFTVSSASTLSLKVDIGDVANGRG